MNSKMKYLGVAAIAALGIFAGVSAAAASAAIESAKASCVVGEQADGYLGFANEGGASEDVKREVRSINQQRKAAYEKLAAKNGVTVDQAAAVTAETLINKAPAGHCYRDQNGAWQKKG